ncbi:MAG: efflux transporter outer membrane subunit, partial [Caulobacteraceae bacterium]
ALYARTRVPTGDVSSLLGGETASSATSTSTTSATSSTSTSSLGSDFSLYNASFDASWEIDIFGGTRRGIEGARAQAQAQRAQLADAQVQLAAEVAQAYVNLRDVQHRAELSKQSGELEGQMLALTRQRRAMGTASQADVERLATQLSQTQAGLVPLQAQIEQYEDQIAMLVATEPGQLDTELNAPAGLPLPPASVPIGDPAALLQRRPDIREAERQLAANTAMIGEATAQLFPKVSLLGSVGFSSTTYTHLFDGDSFTYLGAPSLQWSFLNFGRTQARIREAKAGRDAALAQYHSAVLSALQDANTSLSRFGRQRDNVTKLAEAEQSAARGAILTRDRYRGGTASLIDALDTERQRVQVEENLAQAQAMLTNDYVALQKALGLGWKT